MRAPSVILTSFLVMIVPFYGMALAQEAGATNLTGKWVGRWRTSNYSGPAELTLVQTDKDLSGTVFVGGRPRLRDIRATSYEVSVTGKLGGSQVTLTWLNAEGAKAFAKLALSSEGVLKGPVDTGAGVFSDWELRKSK